jgi:hypothetical protein
MALEVRDASTGSVAFHVDGEVARDDSGRVVGEPRSLRLAKDDASLSTLGSLWLSDKYRGTEGRKVLLDLAPYDVVTPATIAEFDAVADGCVADVVAPVVMIPHDRGVWYVENPGDILRLQIASSTGDAPPAEVNPSYTPTTFVASGQALAAKLPRGTARNADWNLRAKALRYLVEALRIRREKRAADALLATSAWAAGNQITPVSKWNGGAANDPLTDLFAALLASWMPANVLVLPEVAAPYFYTSAVQTYVQAGGELPRVLFARAKYAVGSAGNGQATSGTSYVWSLGFQAGTTASNVLLARCSPDPTSITTAKTFRWVGDSQDGERREGVLVRTFYDKRTDDDWVVVAFNETVQVLSNTIGALIVGAIQ